MEPATSLISRPLPQLTLVKGTNHQSVSERRISAAHLHLWSSFRDDVARALGTLSLDTAVAKHDEQETYMLGSELGLTAHFIRNVCGPVTKALAVTRLAGTVFGDIQCVERQPSHIPDIAVLRQGESPDSGDPYPIIVGEFKPFWTFELERYPVTLPVAHRLNLEPHVGQLVSYMRAFGLRFGFLSTYKSTVFVKRTNTYRFELSTPISRQAQDYSVRECMAAISAMAADHTSFQEPSDMNELLLCASEVPGLQACTRPSQLRAVSALPASSNPCANTIYIGDQTGTLSFRCVRFITGSPQSRKAVMEVEFGGQRCVAKYWRPELQESFAQEAYVYDRLYDMRPDGYRCFASLLAHGSIICSSLLPAGNVLLLQWVDGMLLSETWPQLHRVERSIIRQACREGVGILRQIGVYVLDCGSHNILYNRQTHATGLLDFEVIGACSEEHLENLEAPEMFAIFGDDPGSITGG